MTHFLGYAARTGFLAAMPLGCILSISLAFSTYMRCVTLLILPVLCSSTCPPPPDAPSGDQRRTNAPPGDRPVATRKVMLPLACARARVFVCMCVSVCACRCMRKCLRARVRAGAYGRVCVPHERVCVRASFFAFQQPKRSLLQDNESS